MAPQQKRPPPEYISKLSELCGVWSRKNEEANRLVFQDLDIMMERAKSDAYAADCYEAFAHLTKLHDKIKTGFAAKLQAELDFVNTLPE